MSDAQIERIVDMYNNKTEFEDTSKIVSISGVENANLLCKQYIEDAEVECTIFGTVKITQDKLNVKNKMTPLKNMTESIYRGINSSAKTIEEGKGEYKIIKLSDVQDCKINFNIPSDATLLRQSRINRYLVQRGDVIVSNRGAQINIVVVPEVGDNIILTHNFLGIRCQNDLDPAYLKAFWKVRSVITYLSSSRNDCVNDQSKNLEKVPMYVPKKLEE